MSWFVLNYIPDSPSARKNLETRIFSLAGSNKSEIEIFAPSFIQFHEVKGKIRKVEKPLLYQYLFLKGEEVKVKKICASIPGLSMITDRTRDEGYLQISDFNLENFEKIAKYYNNIIPFYKVTDVDLQEGDKVRIAAGDFAGLEGTYISKKGGKSGNILIAVTQNMAAVVYDIKADYVKVLEFAQNSKRVYDQLDAYHPRLLKAMDSEKKKGLLTTEEKIPLILFCRRFGETKFSNPKIAAKAKAFLAKSYSLLGEKELAEKSYESFAALSKNITNPKIITMIDSLDLKIS